jgi:hypothetical protein
MFTDVSEVSTVSIVSAMGINALIMEAVRTNKPHGTRLSTFYFPILKVTVA